MKRIILPVLILFYAILGCENIRLLVLLPENYGANYYLSREIFEQLGFEITVAGVNPVVNACSYAGQLGAPDITVDYLISEIPDYAIYDCLAIMSASQSAGNPCGDLIASSEALIMISQAAGAGKIIWATCSGVRVLAAAGILNGVQVTGTSSFQGEYENAGAIYLGPNLPAVISGNIITSTRGQYYMVRNCEAVITAMDNLRRHPGGNHE